MNDTSRHFDQKPKRKAEFINPPNHLKQKVGSGGISPKILDKAQKLLESNNVDFRPMAEMHLDMLNEAIGRMRDAARFNQVGDDIEDYIANMIAPAMQLKAHGGMFNYPLVSRIADILVQFLEVIDTVDDDAQEIIMGHYMTLKAVIGGNVADGGQEGDELVSELQDACKRYFSKHMQNLKTNPNDEFSGEAEI